jgi:nucleoside-diphosphate-sugar epimerase
MKALIIGGYNRVTTSIIQKLSKEGCDIYVLTSKKDDKNRFQNVYEHYIFAYENDCIKEVFESVNPDVTVFSGAFDSNYRWSNGYAEVVSFGNGLFNCLNAFMFLGHGRFINLSSTEVRTVTKDEYKEITDVKRDSYSGGYDKYSDIYKGVALKNGESTCCNMRQNTNADIITLRVDNMCYEPEGPDDHVLESDICAKMLIEAYRDKQTTITGKYYSPIYINDFVEALYNIINKTTFQEGIYRLGCDLTITQDELAEKIAAVIESQDDDLLVAKNVEMKQDFLFDDAKVPDVATEVSVVIFKDATKCADLIIEEYTKNPNKFIDREKKKPNAGKRFAATCGRLFQAALPFIENMIVFIPFFMINNRVTGSAYFAKLDPYLIYVEIFAIFCGQQQAVFSSFLAIAGYIFRQSYSRSSFDVMLDYNTYVWMAQLIILGLSVGYLRDKARAIQDDRKDESIYLANRLKDIEDINMINAKLKDELQTQVINQTDSLGKIFEITSTLEQDAPEEVFFHAAEVISDLMDVKDVAIYNVSNRSFARLMSATSPKARSLGNSIEYPKYTEMYDVLVKGEVYVNRKLNNDYPLMAVAISSDSEINSIIMLWNIPWERMNMAQTNRLRVISFMIQNAVLRSDKYMDMLEKERYIENTRILDAEAFRTLLDAFMNARNKGLTYCTLIKVYIPDKDLVKASERLSKLVRTSDYIGTNDDGNAYLLLANTTSGDAAYVEKRLAEADFEYKIIDRLER